MHDLKFANEIIVAIKKRSKNAPQAKAIVVTARLSPFSHVTPEGLRETFAQLASAENLQDVTLDISPLEFDLVCRECEETTKGFKLIFNCPKCKSTDFDIHKEKEFIIDSIEVK